MEQSDVNRIIVSVYLEHKGKKMHFLAVQTLEGRQKVIEMPCRRQIMERISSQCQSIDRSISFVLLHLCAFMYQRVCRRLLHHRQLSFASNRLIFLLMGKTK